MKYRIEYIIKVNVFICIFIYIEKSESEFIKYTY